MPLPANAPQPPPPYPPGSLTAVLTRDEIDGLSAGLCVSGDPPVTTTPTRLSEWLTAHKDTLGRVYAAELRRHYR